MGVIGTRYQNGFGNVQTLGTAIHAALLLQGWTISYANDDAVGIGLPSNPAWTKSATSGTSAGVVVYRMPAFGVFNRWFLQIELRWGAAGGGAEILQRFTTAQGVNASNGVLTNPGTTYGTTTSGGNPNNSGESWLGTWEHGFLLMFNNSGLGNNSISGIERRRDFLGNVQDDCVTYQATSSQGTVGFGGAHSFDNLTRSWISGERSIQPLGILMGQGTAASSSSRVVTTYNQPSGNIGFPMGFYTTSGGLGGMLRLIQLWLGTDSNNNAGQDVFVDGAARQYFGVNTGAITPNGQRVLLAQN